MKFEAKGTRSVSPNTPQSESSNFTASDILLKAASRIEEEGMWCQRRFFADVEVGTVEEAFALRQESTQRVPECALGALVSTTVALGLGLDEYYRAQDLLFHEIEKLPDAAWIAGWNDAPGRSADEVADAMRRAAL